MQYLKNYRNLAGLINVDWFQPYGNSFQKRKHYYWSNSRSKRAEREYKFFIKAQSDELLDLWNGVVIKENDDKAYYKFVLIGSSSELAATRKLCGFKSYNATKGKL